MQPALGHLEWLQAPGREVQTLIVAPHPDDEVLGPGGRAILEQDRGVAAVIVTDGARGASGGSEPGLPARREQESVEGLRRVGAVAVLFLRLPSSSVQTDPSGEAARGIAWAIESWLPSTVLTTAPFEHHRTHIATTRATLAALRRGSHRPVLLGYPVWDPIAGESGVEVVDVSAVLEQKLEAIRCHSSQMAARPFDETTRCRHFLDAQLRDTTGPADAQYVEKYVDLSELADPDGPDLEQWLNRRFRDLAGSLLEQGS